MVGSGENLFTHSGAEEEADGSRPLELHTSPLRTWPVLLSPSVWMEAGCHSTLQKSQNYNVLATLHMCS